VEAGGVRLGQENSTEYLAKALRCLPERVGSSERLGILVDSAALRYCCGSISAASEVGSFDHALDFIACHSAH